VPFAFGGRLCLDFANTVNFRNGQAACDYLLDYASLLEWAWQLHGIDADQYSTVKSIAEREPSHAAEAYRAAMELREAVYRLFRSIARGETSDKMDLTVLNRVLASARRAQELVVGSPNFDWRFSRHGIGLDLPVYAVAISASELLTHEDVSRIGECPPPDGCGWLFYDATKNRSRRWCSMEYCGATSKLKRYKAKHGKGARSESSSS
jgi:predicted RNA-binding Zn ribbon-like protein